MATYTELRKVPIPVRIPSHAPSRIDLEIVWDEEYPNAELAIDSVSVLIEGRGGYGYLVPVMSNKGTILEGLVAGELISATGIPNLIEVLSNRAHEMRRDDKSFWTLRKDFL